MTKLRQTLWFAFAPLWRWKWLLLVSLLFTIGYSLFATCRRRTDDPPPNIVFTPATPRFESVVHGWPFEYGNRAYYFSNPHHRWLIWRDLYNFAPYRLLANLALAGAVSASLTYFAAWRYSPVRPFQFRLFDLIGLTAVVAATLWAGLYLENVYQADRKYMESLQSQRLIWHADYQAPIWYRRPFRDLGLLSHDAIYAAGISSTSPTWHFRGKARPEASWRLNTLLAEEVAAGRHLQMPIVWVAPQAHPLNDEGIAAFTQWAPTCRNALAYGDATLTDQGTQAIVDGWPNLEILQIGSPQLSEKSLQSIAMLPELKLLYLANCSLELRPADFDQMAHMPKLAHFCIPFDLHDQFTPQQLDAWEKRGVTFSRNADFRTFPPPEESP